MTIAVSYVRTRLKYSFEKKAWKKIWLERDLYCVKKVKHLFLKLHLIDFTFLDVL